jgi:dimethylamine/trimethylamine dehydrogenase
LGRQHRATIDGIARAEVLSHLFSPDDVFAGATLPSPVLIYDDDHYYMAGALAERLRKQGLEVHLVTPSVKVSEFTDMTMEQQRIQAGLLKMGVTIQTTTSIASVSATSDHCLRVELANTYTDARTPLQCASLLLVTMRDPVDGLFVALQARQAEWHGAGVKTVQCVGDAYAPGTVAAAVYAGHRAAREMDAQAQPLDAVPFKREIVATSSP